MIAVMIIIIISNVLKFCWFDRPNLGLALGCLVNFIFMVSLAVVMLAGNYFMEIDGKGALDFFIASVLFAMALLEAIMGCMALKKAREREEKKMIL